MELLDYLAWRNDVPLSVSPFNEVDNVIFSYLSYIDFRDLKEDWNGFFDLRDFSGIFVKSIPWKKSRPQESLQSGRPSY